jgi:hypothetical protein
MQHMIGMFTMSSTDLDATFRKGVGIVLGRGVRMLKNDVQMAVRPGKRAIMCFIRLVRDHPQSAGPRALERNPYRDEKHGEERSNPEHPGEIRRSQ